MLNSEGWVNGAKKAKFFDMRHFGDYHHGVSRIC